MNATTFGNILYVSRAFQNYRRQLKPDEALGPGEMYYISFIYRNPGCSQEQIAAYTGMDKTTVAHRLNKLEKLDYVRREVSREDARMRLCYPTEKAGKIYPALHEQYLKFNEKVLGDFTEEELKVLDDLSSRMRKNARELILEQEK